MEKKELKDKLKQLIIDTCEKDENIEDISDDEILFGEDAPLQLDSMDALQISMALGSTYNIKMTDSKKLRKIMASINTMADFIISKR
jgi:acyl carrier protein